MLFDPLELRQTALPNRIVLGPMQMYMAKDGFANDWHFTHLNTYARGGFGTVFTEALAVDPVGRATYGDMGAWSDEHLPGLTRLATAIRNGGGVPAAQLWHAGAKASRRVLAGRSRRGHSHGEAMSSTPAASSSAATRVMRGSAAAASPGRSPRR